MRKYRYYARSIVELLTGFENWVEVARIFAPWRQKTPPGLNSERTIVRLRKRGLRFQVRGKMDIWSVKEALIDRFYCAPGFCPQNGWVVVDIGAGIGEFTLEAAVGFPDSRVYAYEPFSESFCLLMKNIDLNPVENVKAYQKAVWSQAGRLQLGVSTGEPLQLESRPLASGSPAGIDVVESLTLADVLQADQLTRVDLLKLDCEGAEFDILMTAQADTLACVERIVLEYHDAARNIHHGSLVSRLQVHGFDVFTVPNQVHAGLGYLYASRGQHT